MKRAITRDVSHWLGLSESRNNIDYKLVQSIDPCLGWLENIYMREIYGFLLEPSSQFIITAIRTCSSNKASWVPLAFVARWLPARPSLQEVSHLAWVRNYVFTRKFPCYKVQMPGSGIDFGIAFSFYAVWQKVRSGFDNGNGDLCFRLVGFVYPRSFLGIRCS